MTIARAAPLIECAIEAEAWAALDAPAALAEAVIGEAIALSHADLAPRAEISIVFCDDAFIRALNRKWRGADRATNVLSFPSGGDLATAPILGDIVIAFETASREAGAAGRPLRDHAAHLLAHGFLHLIGYDHIEDAEAEEMEALEARILARLGVADPYKDALDLAGR